MSTILKRLSVGFVDVEPGIVSLKTTLTNAQIMVPGFLNNIYPNTDVTPVASDFVFANCSDGSELYTLKFEPTGIIALIPAGGTIHDGVNYNVSQLNGNDATANGSLELQFKTINAALSYIKTNIGNNPINGVNINITDDQIYDEKLDFTGTTNINLIGPTAQLVWTGFGSALTFENTMLVTLARVHCASNNSLHLNGPGAIVASIDGLTAGPIVASGTGLILIKAFSILPTATTTAPAQILYSAIYRANPNLDGLGVTGVSMQSASKDWTINGILKASGLNYPAVDAAAGSVMTTDGAGNLSLQPVSADILPNGIQIYVSKQIGNDANSGTFLSPLKTINAALTLAGSPTYPVQIIIMDGEVYDEQLVLNNPNVYINGPVAQLIYTGLGDAITINSAGNAALFILANVQCNGIGKTIVNNANIAVVFESVNISGGDIVNNSTGLVIIKSSLIQANITNPGGGSVFYSADIRSGTDAIGVIGINSNGSTAPTFTTNSLVATNGLTVTNSDIVCSLGQISAPAGGISCGTNIVAGANLGGVGLQVGPLFYANADGAPGDVLTTNGAGTLTLQPPAATGFTSINMQIFTTNATYTPTPGMKDCMVEVVGGGGGGGGVTSAAGHSAAAGGGGSGAYSRSIFDAATIGVSQPVVVGGGGFGAAPGANNGGDGGSSSLGALIEADGGHGGFGATASAAAISIGIFGASGGSGTGQFVVAGETGLLGTAYGASQLGIGGGGGSGLYGSGAEQLVNLPGANGFAHGGGGGGGSSGNTGNVGGGAGANGVVIITEYI